MIMILAVLLWFAQAIAQTMRFRPEESLSEYELQRRIDAHDAHAMEMARYNQQIPLLESLRGVMVTLFGVLMVTTLVVGLGPVNGILLGAAGLLLSPLAQRLKVICRLADKLALMSRPYALRAVHTLAPVLKWLRDRDLAQSETKVYSSDELVTLLERSPDVLSKDQMARLRASLAFDDKLVSDVMTPRTVIDTADVRDSVGPLVLDGLHKTGHSRFPVIDGDIDHVVGMLYMHDLIDLKSSHKTVKAAMDPRVYYIHESKDLLHALHAFLHTHHHLFIVVNEYRETVGLVSLEDVLEALIGKTIVDEFDQFDDLRAVAQSNPRKNNVSQKSHDV